MLIYVLALLVLGDEPSSGVFSGGLFTDIVECEAVARVLMQDQSTPRIVYCKAYKPLEET